MSAANSGIFISSVQKELAEDRRAVKTFIENDPLLRRFFTVFCEGLFLARYVEKYGTGTLMMIRESLAHNLPEPDFVQRGGEFTIALWRDWMTDEVLAGYSINERKRRAVQFLKIHGTITNSQYQKEFLVAKRTASLDLSELVAVGLIEKAGSTGKGVYYRLAKGAAKGQKGQ